MKTISLNFYQRFSLEGAISSFPIPKVKEAAMYLRWLHEIRLSEAERRQANYTQEGTRVSWELPNAQFGAKALELEDTDAEALAVCLENLENVRVLDAEWLMKLCDQLRGVKEARAA